MLRPTFMGFETARRGIAASQKAMDIAGNNLTNWATPGYTRQRMDTVSIASSDYSSRYASNRVGVAGQGVDTKGISQVRDSFLDKRFRDESADAGYYNQKNKMLTEIEDAISEFDINTGVTGSLNALAGVLKGFISNADSETSANNFASSFKSLTLLLRQYGQNLDKVAEQQKYNLELAVDDMNSAFSRLADLNKIIAADVGVTGNPVNEYYGPNELMDERNLLLDELASKGNLEVTNNSDGTVTLKMNGHTVVDGNKYEKINTFRYNDSGTMVLNWQSDGKPVNFSSGTIQAAMEVINGRGPGVSDATQRPEKGVLYYKDKLNALAATLADRVNHMIPEQVDADNNPVPPPPDTVYKTLVGARVMDPATGKFITTTDVPVTADNISISDEWAKDAGYIIIERGNKTTAQYLMNLQGTLFTEKNVFNTYGESYTGTFSEYIKDYALSSLGTEVKFNENRFKSHGLIKGQIEDARDDVSAVSQDEETTNLLMFNRTFQAASRLMTTLDEALDLIINRTGLVGR